MPNLILNCSLVHNGMLLHAGTAAPEGLSEAMLKSLMESGMIVEGAPPASSSSIHVPPAGTTEETPAPAPAPAPMRLAPDKAVDPSAIEGMDLEELNVLAAEKGWEGEAFTEAVVAKNFLSANFPR